MGFQEWVGASDQDMEELLLWKISRRLWPPRGSRRDWFTRPRPFVRIDVRSARRKWWDAPKPRHEGEVEGEAVDVGGES